jgi:hypothetical protein
VKPREGFDRARNGFDMAMLRKNECRKTPDEKMTQRKSANHKACIGACDLGRKFPRATRGSRATAEEKRRVNT